MIKVKNITNANGNEVPNQFEIIVDEYPSTYKTTFFQSYDSIIAKVRGFDGQIYLDEKYWDYSITTLRHLYNFLDMWGYDLNKKKVLQLIEDGKFKLTNLNKGWKIYIFDR